jgi:hypothetical protein
MRFIVAGFLLAFALPAGAAPTCYGGEDGCTANRIAHVPGGMCIAWYQATADEWEPQHYCLRYADIAPDEKGSIAELWFGPAADRAAVWERQVTRALGSDESSLVAILLEPVPPSLYVVKPYFTGSRPTYPLIDGKRSTKSNGRIAVGEPCSGPAYDTSYRQVGTNMVAICDRR